ncbi:MAG: hypothetical protein JWQ28_1692 [Pedobacter sp.]|jgi:hypothetical protein|nr:hypothetical protein [Pedobacter sp.]
MNSRKITLAIVSIAICGLSFSAQAQEKKESVGKTISKTASTVGNKTAEVAVKGASKIRGKIYKGKMAPDGSDVYIDNRNRKYYVNKKGGKVYLKTYQIKTRPATK